MMLTMWDDEKIAALESFVRAPFIVAAGYALVHFMSLWAALASRPFWFVRLTVLLLPPMALFAFPVDPSTSENPAQTMTMAE